MDEQALIRAAEITLRRMILANFPPGPERDRRLERLERAVSGRHEALQGHFRTLDGPTTDRTWKSALRGFQIKDLSRR
jgi:hypothetical protein